MGKPADGKKEEQKSPSEVVKETLQTAKGKEWKKAEALETEMDKLMEEEKIIISEGDNLGEEIKQINAGLKDLEDFVSKQKDKDEEVLKQIEDLKLRKEQIIERRNKLVEKARELDRHISEMKSDPIFLQREKELTEAYTEEAKVNRVRDEAEWKEREAEKERKKQEKKEEERKEIKAEMKKMQEEVKGAAESLIKIWEEDKEHFLHLGGADFKDEIDPWEVNNKRNEEREGKIAKIKKDLREIDERISHKEKGIFKFGLGKLQKEKNVLEENIKEMVKEGEKVYGEIKKKSDEFYKRNGEAEESLREKLGKYLDLLIKAKKIEMLNDVPAAAKKEFPYYTESRSLGDERYVIFDYSKLFEAHNFNFRTRERR